PALRKLLPACQEVRDRLRLNLKQFWRSREGLLDHFSATYLKFWPQIPLAGSSSFPQKDQRSCIFVGLPFLPQYWRRYSRGAPGEISHLIPVNNKIGRLSRARSSIPPTQSRLTFTATPAARTT